MFSWSFHIRDITYKTPENFFGHLVALDHEIGGIFARSEHLKLPDKFSELFFGEDSDWSKLDFFVWYSNNCGGVICDVSIVNYLFTKVTCYLIAILCQFHTQADDERRWVKMAGNISEELHKEYLTLVRGPVSGGIYRFFRLSIAFFLIFWFLQLLIVFLGFSAFSPYILHPLYLPSTKHIPTLV